MLFELLAAVIPLQWNATYPTDVPYECEFVPTRLGLAAASGFVVKADGKSLPTQRFRGSADGTTTLRFRVPAGTRALACETVDAASSAVDSMAVDNLFAGALAKGATWTCDGVRQTEIPGGHRFAATAAGTKVASWAVELPPRAAQPLPVRLELDVKSVASMTWGAKMVVAQFDAAGRELPEYVTDGRWTTEMLPPQKAVAFRERGLVHPQTRRIVFRIEMLARDRTVDEFGLPRQPGSDAYPQLELTHLALRPAAELPFPRYDAAKFFGAGVSSAPTDRSLKLGAGQAFWYQTRGPGSWARGEQYRDESEIFFPAGAGTVEAWFRPDWSGATSEDFYLFEGSSHQLAIVPKAVEFPGRATLFAVRYQPATKRLSFFRRDRKDRVFKGEANVEIPSGRWTHVACTFAPGGRAVVYLDGHRALEVALTDFVPLDLAADPLPNNTDVVECYLGSGHLGARVRERAYRSEPLLTGEVDLWRVSTGVRYETDFTPAKSFAVDGATRALFAFDDTFDGVAGGGLGFVRGTLRATSGRRLNRVAVDGRDVPYHPAELQPENDPDRVLDRLTYPTMPTEEELWVLRRPLSRRFTLKPGEKASFAAGEKVYPDFVEIANGGESPLVFPLVLNEGEVDPRSFGDFAESLDAMGLSDREKVNRTFNFLLKASDYFIADTATYEPDSNVPRCVMSKALTMINGYCGFECGPLNTMAANLFACAARCPANMTGGYGHSFQQVFFDGKNHLYDLSAQKFFPSFDNETSVSLGEDEDEPGVHWRVGGAPSHFIRLGTRTFGATDPGYWPKVGVSLNPGERFRAWFDNCAEVNDLYCSTRLDGMIRGKTRNFFMPYAPFARETGADDKVATMRRMERFFPQYGNGFLVFEGRPTAANPAFVDEGKSFRYRVASGYPIVAGAYVAARADGSAAEVELSFDGGRRWQSFGTNAFDYPVRARHAYWVRVKAAMKDVVSFRAKTTVQLNARIFPGRVRAGANVFRLKAVSGGAAEVTLGWRENARPIELEGAVATGTIPGAEKVTAAMDPTEGALVLAVKGLSADATVESGPGFAATLAGGRLTVTADDATPRIGFVTIRDGGAEKALTVVSCPGARFVRRAATIVKAGDRADYDFRPLPAGDYMLLSVVRFASHPQDLLGTAVAAELDAEPSRVAHAAAAVNPLANYYKAHYGQKGGRANWKWDFALDPKTFRPFWGPQRFTAKKPLSRVTFTAPTRPPEGGAEIAAVLVLPFPADEFRCRLEKVLCGLNACPERVR